MSQGTVNATNTNVDATVRLYDSFYAYDADVPANEYDVVLSFFKQTMENNQAAGNMTVSLFQIAEITKIPVLTLLDSMKGKNGIDLSINMAYFMNNIRSRSTLLGVNASATPNFYAVRNVLQ